MLCKNLVHLWCILCPLIWQTSIGPRSNLLLLDICGLLRSDRDFKKRRKGEKIYVLLLKQYTKGQKDAEYVLNTLLKNGWKMATKIGSHQGSA